jgi:hypothetical protein
MVLVSKHTMERRITSLVAGVFVRYGYRRFVEPITFPAIGR